MKFLESIIYGFVSGLCEILPVSSRAHQNVLMKFFGVSEVNPLLNLMIRMAVIAAIIINCRSAIERLRNLQTYKKRSRRQSSRNVDYRFLKVAAISLIITLILFTYTLNSKPTLPRIAICSLLNGFILFLPSRMMQGNKDSNSMSAFDSVTMGVLGATSMLPGISRIGIMTSYATLRGADKGKSLNWVLLLSLPALLTLILFDFIAMFSGFQAVSFGIFLGYILAMGAAFAACYFAIVIMRFLSVRTGFSGFAYYSWGVALFSFVLYLI